MKQLGRALPGFFGPQTVSASCLHVGLRGMHLPAMGGWTRLEMVSHYAQLEDVDLLQAHREHGPIDWLQPRHILGVTSSSSVENPPWLRDNGDGEPALFTKEWPKLSMIVLGIILLWLS
jgi:hypothetical protein